MGRPVPDPSPFYDRSAPMPSVEKVYAYALQNVPGFSAVALRVTFPPGAQHPPHRHGGASVVGCVLAGSTLNKMNDEPTMLLGAGETWYEAPGCHHRVSANASATDELVLFATFVIETDVWEAGGIQALVKIDDEYLT
ncbi:hypothetical protein CDD83_9662 [Cordyceps sp. RAO-2017]|nr:hypothetical protein CDD83_9662 [Cordyceps sp. RAO-2017]